MRNLQILLGLGGAFLFLALALHRVPLAAVGAALFAASPPWLAAAVLVYAANLALRAWRWQRILRAVRPVPYPTMARALVVGYGLNAIMPLRLGELFRAEFCHRDFGLPRPWALTSIVVERLYDGVAVVACLGAGLSLAAASGRVSATLTGVLATAGLMFGGGALVLLAFSGSLLSRVFARFPRAAAPIVMVERGLRVLRTRRALGLALATALVNVLDALSLWCLVKAVGVGLGPADALVLVGAASLSTLLPSGPGFLGTLQFAYALVIGFAGAPRADGIAAATLAQLVLLLPLAVIAAAVLLHKSRRLLLAAPPEGDADDGPAGRPPATGQTPPQVASATATG